MKKLSKIQQAHFRKMSREERKAAISDFEKQMSVIAMSSSDAADSKREEMQARIDFCLELNRQ